MQGHHPKSRYALFAGALLGAWLAVIRPQATQAQVPARCYRHYARVDDAFYNSAFTDFSGDNLSDRMADAQSAEARAKELADLGFTGVVYGGRHFRLSHESQWDQINRTMRIVTDACHRHGISVVEHHDFTIFAYSSYPLMLEHLDWLQRDLRTGVPDRWASPSNPNFLKFYADYLQRMQKAGDPDGYMLDELSFIRNFNTGDRYSRQAFHADTGLTAPNWATPDSQRTSEVYRRLMAWRPTQIVRANQYLMDAVRAIKPSVVRMSYKSDYSDPHAGGADLEQSVSWFCSFMGWENMNAEALNGWRPYLREMKLRDGMGDYYGIPMWSLNRELTSKEAVYFGWALCQLGKHSIWYGVRGINTPEELAYFRNYNTWKPVMPHQYARCLTDTGLLLSDQTRIARQDRDFYWNDLAGWVDMMMVGNRQFDTLLDGDLYLPDRLGKYQVLLLINQAALADAQVKRLEQWVHNGGTAVLAMNTALYDEHGTRRKDFALSDAANIHWLGSGPSGTKVTGKLGETPVDFVIRHGMEKVSLRDKGRSSVLATTVIGGQTTPIIIETPYGKGRFIYVAADLGTQNLEMEMRNQSVYRTQEDPALRQAILAIDDYAHRTPPPAQLELPDGVVGVAYQEHGGPRNGTIYVHLLNVKGKSLKPGYVSQYGRIEKIPLPKIGQPMRIRLRAKLTGDAAAITPERRGQTTVVNAKDIGNGVVELTVPGSALGAYLEVRVAADPVAGQQPPPVPLALDSEQAALNQGRSHADNH